MTEPPAAPPPPDPTADPPPFSTPHSPPYPSEGGEFPTYLPGSAPVEPPSADPVPTYPPVTSVPAYGQGPATGSRRLVIGVAVALVFAIAVCGVIGVTSFVLLGENDSSSSSEPVAAAPSQAPTDAPGQGLPTDFPTGFPTALPTSFPTDFPIPRLADGTPHTVVYEVTGDGRDVAVAYFGDRDFLDVQSEQVDLPWRKEVTFKSGFPLVTLTAYGLPGDEISCRISVDGKQVASATGDGSAVCFGTAIR